MSLEYPEITLDMGSANERWRYDVSSYLIAWVHTQHDFCQIWIFSLIWPHCLVSQETLQKYFQMQIFTLRHPYNSNNVWLIMVVADALAAILDPEHLHPSR